MAGPSALGNRRGALFPSLLLGLSRPIHLDWQCRSSSASRRSDLACGIALRWTRLGRSALQQWIDPLLEFRDRRLAPDLLAVDEEGRCRVHFQHFRRVFLIGCDLVEQRLIVQAGLDLILAQARLPA